MDSNDEAARWRRGQAECDLEAFNQSGGAAIGLDQVTDEYAQAIAKCVQLTAMADEIFGLQVELEERGLTPVLVPGFAEARSRDVGQLVHILQALAWRLSPLFRSVIETNEVIDDAARLAAGLGVALKPLLPQCRAGRDIVLVPLPADVAGKALDGLLSLARGGVPDIFTPAPSDGHGDAHTWDQMRLAAVQHVAYLAGQGVKKTIARERVAVATGVGEETLRKWERTFGSDTAEYQLAYEAGAWFANLRGGVPTQGLDADLQYLIDSFSAEPLENFGKRYQEKYGKRQWSKREK